VSAGLSQFCMQYVSHILWKESHLRCVATFSGHLNTRWTLCEQERELRSKCNEVEKSGGKTFWVTVSCDESCTRLHLCIFSTKMFKICALFSRTAWILKQNILLFVKCYSILKTLHYFCCGLYMLSTVYLESIHCVSVGQYSVIFSTSF
jgi:hypothetical protein